MNRSKPQNGITLLELIISMTILLGLISGALTYYNHNQKFVRQGIQKNILPRTADDALNAIHQNIHMAGYSGCAGIYGTNRKKYFNNNFPAPWHWRNKDTSWQPPINSTYVSPAKRNSGELIIQRSQTEPIIIQSVLNKHTFRTKNTHHLKTSDWIWLTNCQFSILARVNDVMSEDIITIHSEQNQYYQQELINFTPHAGDKIYKINWYFYYLAEDKTNNNLSTLYIKENHKPAIPLVANITKLQFHQAGNNNALIISVSAALTSIDTYKPSLSHSRIISAPNLK